MQHPQTHVDTDLRAAPGQKIIDSLKTSDTLFGSAEAGVRLAHPQASDREVFLRAAARQLSPALMRKVYGWHPDDESADTSA